MAVFALLAVLILSATQKISSVWKSALAKTEQFRESRRAMETVSRRLESAVLNPYVDYKYPGGNTTLPPTSYFLKSDLRFLSLPAKDLAGATLTAVNNPTHSVFFQAPAGWVTDRANYGGLEWLVNTFGYFIEYTEAVDPVDPTLRKSRYRLVELREPSENLSVYRWTQTSDTYKGKEWATVPLGVPANRRIVADNVIALILLPKVPDAAKNLVPATVSGSYMYDSSDDSRAGTIFDSTNRLPYAVEVIVVALDEDSAARVCTSSTPPVLVASTLFTNPAQLEADLTTLKTSLDTRSPPLRYTIDRATITLPPQP